MTNRERRAGRPADGPRDDGATKTGVGSRSGISGNLQSAPIWATLVATFFGAGRMRPGPGTWGSAATVILWWLVGHKLALAWQPWVAFLLASIAVLVGIPAATRVARASGLNDPQFVVIDEVAGQLFTLIASPITWQSLLLGFILFRAFDIVKPPPIRRLERLPEGVGIVIDDVGAGIYGLAIMQMALHFGLLSPSR